MAGLAVSSHERGWEPFLSSGDSQDSVEPLLIVGSEGFIGRSLKTYLSERGWKLFGVDLVKGADLVVDITEYDRLAEELKTYRFSSVIHLAALSNPPSCGSDPLRCLRTNVLGTQNVLELARRIGVKRFILLSSANVYGPRPPLPVKEDAATAPRALYDYSKLMSEMAAQAYHTLYGVPVVIFRSWKVFGEYDSPTSAVSRFIDACLEGREITLYNGGRDVTDPYHVVNLCHAVELALRREEAVGEVFNLGTGRAVSIRELAETIRRLTSSQSRLVDLPPRTPEEAEPMISYPSIEKAERLLGYKPIMGLEEGLMKVINYRRLNANH